MRHPNKSILCGIILVFSLTASAQNDTVKCFGITEQKKILSKFIELEKCKEWRTVDSLHIKNMDSVRVQLVNKVDQQSAVIQTQRNTIEKRNRQLLFGIPSAFIVGVLTRFFL